MDRVVLIIALAVVIIPAVIFDIRSRRIPNLLSLAGIILGFGLNVFFHGLSGAADAGLGLLWAFGISLPFWLMGWAGAGDVKLVSAVGAIVGASLVLPVLAAIAIAGGAVALVYVIALRLQREPLYIIMASSIFSEKPDGEPEKVDDAVVQLARKGIPYAIPVAIGSLTAIVYLS